MKGRLEGHLVGCSDTCMNSCSGGDCVITVQHVSRVPCLTFHIPISRSRMRMIYSINLNWLDKKLCRQVETS